MQFEGANVVVTGAARGIGAALAQRFHAGGANVVFADVIDPAKATNGLERAAGVVADVSSEGGNVTLISTAEQAFGPIDLFFANAGIIGRPTSGRRRLIGISRSTSTSTLIAGRHPTCSTAGSHAAAAISARPPRPPDC